MKHRHTRLLGKAVVLTAGLGLALNVAAAEFEFRANTVGNKDSIAYAGLERFKELAEARSEGAIEFRLFDSGALGDQISGIEGMQSGTLSIATVETPITEVDPLMGVTALPYIFRDREHVETVLDGPTGDWIERRLADKGLRVLGYLEGGFRQITNDVRPIHKPADLDGIKMRTPDSDLRVKIFNHYGANASPLPFTELYPALQTGVFDGQENPIIWVKSSRFYEVQDYLSFTNHLYTVTYLLMSEDEFQKLPERLKLVVQQAGREAAQHTVEVGRKADKEIVDFLKDKGMKVNQADSEAFAKASRPLWDEWAQQQDDTEQARALIHAISTAGLQAD